MIIISHNEPIQTKNQFFSNRIFCLISNTVVNRNYLRFEASLYFRTKLSLTCKQKTFNRTYTTPQNTSKIKTTVMITLPLPSTPS